MAPSMGTVGHIYIPLTGEVAEAASHIAWVQLTWSTSGRILSVSSNTDTLS